MEVTDEAIEIDVLNLNRTAMNSLKDQNYSKALNSLKKASVLINNIELPEKRMKLQGITLNNFGCFYKRSKMPNVALKYLTKACTSEKEGLVDSVGIAATHLNMCAIYSELGRHELALQEGLLSLDLLKTALEYSPNYISTLVIAYHNTGVEYEFLKNYQEAYQCYKKAWETSLQHLGPAHPLTQSALENCSLAENKLQDLELRQTKDSLNREMLTRNTRTRFRSAEKRPKSRGAELNSSHKNNFTLRQNLSPKFPEDLLENPFEPRVQSIRFLTGERLQPMFKQEIRVNSLPRGTIRKRNGGSLVNDKGVAVSSGLNSISIKKKKVKINSLRIERPAAPDKQLKLDKVQRKLIEKFEVGQKNVKMSKFEEKLQTREKKKFIMEKNLKKFEGNVKKSEEKLKKIEDKGKKIEDKGKMIEDKRKNLEDFEKFEVDISELDRLIEQTVPGLDCFEDENQDSGNHAALKIQKAFRGFRVRKSMQVKKDSEILKTEALKKAQNLKKAQKERQKKYLAEEEIGLDVIPEIPDAATPVSEDNQIDPVLSVQGLIRGYLQRNDFMKKTRAAIFIQKHVRRFVVAKLYKKIREAIQFIQSTYRDYISKKRNYGKAIKSLS